MVTQEAVLRWLAGRAEQGRFIGYDDLAREFSISLGAASGHLTRLWRDRLIEAQGDRPARFRFRLTPGEPLRSLRFDLAGRGRERLRWFDEQPERERGRTRWL